MENSLRTSTSDDADRFHLAWMERPSDLHTPVRLFLTLRGRGHQVCLLESAEGPDRIARYSFLALDPVEKFTAGSGTPHLELQELADRTRIPDAPAFLPPFRGGWIGYMPYEWVSTLEPRVPAAASDPWQLPVAEFHLFETVLAFDHAAQRLILITSCSGAAGHGAALELLHGLVEEIEGSAPCVEGFRLRGDGPSSNMDRETFVAGVELLQQYISEGEIFQAVLSQRFDQEFEGDPFALYRALRLTNPSPHMFYFEGEGLTLVGSSPERLVSVQAGRVENRPIAGTRSRGVDAAEDERLGAELLADPKEKSEHAMLVDLARNDLGRIARFGSVEVKENMALEKFARVQHLVSRVECDLASGQVPMDALAASFPAGTVSGAPKIRAMELLSEIEPETRGPYAGAFGYLDSSGNLDMAITIRTFVVRGDTVSVQAGAGIVFDSRPEREYQETLEKADALFQALRLAESSSFSPTADMESGS
ncbi:MAG: anthranilate synthase component I family protein [Planctomycetota bacterium]|jgi:anthranilate synthase component 1